MNGANEQSSWLPTIWKHIHVESSFQSFNATWQSPWMILPTPTSRPNMPDNTSASKASSIVSGELIGEVESNRNELSGSASPL